MKKMIGLMLAFFMASLLCSSPAPAAGQVKSGQTRGELLYTMHCATCHTTEIHWREKKTATDLSSLTAQVRRWQLSISLGWSEDEIHDVVRYLNAVYYHFKADGKKNISERE